MARVEKSIEIEKPLRTVYDQWTQFEEFPRFMEGVEEVHQMDDRTLHWMREDRREAGGVGRGDRPPDPDQRIAWRHRRGAVNSGVVTFSPIDADRCRGHLALEYEPQGFVEKVGDMLGVVSRRVEGDLERFKRFIEERGDETGAWRGEIRPGGGTPHPS